MEQAHQLLVQYPDRRLEYFAGQARATVSYYLGDMATAVGQFRKSLPLGTELGDEQHVRYGEVFLAEALLLCGNYGEARNQLRATAKAAAEQGGAVRLRHELGSQAVSSGTDHYPR